MVPFFFKFFVIGCNIRDNLPAINSPSLHKDNANRMQNFHACMKKLCWDAAYLIQRWKKAWTANSPRLFLSLNKICLYLIPSWFFTLVVTSTLSAPT